MIALVLGLGLWPTTAASAAPAGSPAALVALKGFVVARDDSVLTVRNGDGSLVGVRLTRSTVVAGVRTSRGEITLRDLVRIEGVRERDGLVVAARVDVVLGGEGVQVTRPGLSVFWNWILNGSLAVPVR